MQSLMIQGGEKMEKKEVLTQVVRQVQADNSKFESLYTEMISNVYYWCYVIVKDEATAKDLAQESMIQLYYKLHTLKNPEIFTSWMYTLVRNVCYGYLRSNKYGDMVSLEKETYIKEKIKEEKIECSPAESYSLKETKKLIESFIGQLPRRQREVISLFYLEEFTLGEIAKTLDYNIGSVKSRLHSGRKNLEKKIKDYEQKHGTKLYSITLLPLLGEILQEYRDNLNAKQDLSYNQNLFQSKNLMRSMRYRIQGLKPLTIGGIVIASIAVIAVIATGAFLGLSGNEDGASELTPKANAETFDKSKQNAYIESVESYAFPTRDQSQVVIHLKKGESHRKVKILYKEKNVPFEKKGETITVTVKENGIYTVYVDKKKTSFTVKNIEPYAPELEGVQSHETYLKLVIRDERSQINYEKSYIDYEGRSYPITKEQIVSGSFKGSITVYLYNDLGQYRYYEFNLK